MGEPVGLGDVPDAPAVIVPTAAVAARSSYPGGVVRGFEGRDFSGGLDRLEQTPFVITAEGVDECTRTTVVPAKEVESAGGCVGRERLEPRDRCCWKADHRQAPFTPHVSNLRAAAELLRVPGSRDVLQDVRRAIPGRRRARGNEQGGSGRRNREVRDLLI